MKNVFIYILLCTLATTAYSQSEKDTTYWQTDGNLSLNFSELSFSNWATGGKNSISGVGLINYSAKYTKNKIAWENAFHFGYGLLKEGKNDATKSEDKIDISSKLGLKSTSEKIFYTALFNFRTQFANGYNYPNTDKISGFMSPGYLNLAFGLDYKPVPELSIFLSPLGGKVTIVGDENLAVKYGLDAGSKTRSEFGATFKSQLKTPVVKNVDIDTQVSLFSNYLEKPQNIDVLWDLIVNMKVNNFLSVNFISNLIYDDNITIKKDDGSEEPATQFKQLLGVGFNLKF